MVILSFNQKSTPWLSRPRFFAGRWRDRPARHGRMQQSAEHRSGPGTFTLSRVERCGAGAEFGNQVQLMFDKDLAASEHIFLEQWQHRALHLRLKEWFARVWEYWL